MVDRLFETGKQMENVISRKMGYKLDQIINETSATIDRSIQITKDDFTRRWKLVQKSMLEKGYDLLCVYGSELDRSNVAWLVGFYDPIIESYMVLVPSQGIPIILAVPEEGFVIEEATERSGANIIMLKEFQIPEEEYRWVHLVTINQVLEDHRGDKQKR